MHKLVLHLLLVQHHIAHHLAAVYDKEDVGIHLLHILARDRITMGMGTQTLRCLRHAQHIVDEAEA